MNEMTYTPKVGDRVKWYNSGPYTVTAVGKQHVLVLAESGWEFATNITDLNLIPDTVTIEIPREVAEFAAGYWRGPVEYPSNAIGDACRAALEGEK